MQIKLARADGMKLMLDLLKQLDPDRAGDVVLTLPDVLDTITVTRFELHYHFTDWLIMYEVNNTERWERLRAQEWEYLAEKCWRDFIENLLPEPAPLPEAPAGGGISLTIDADLTPEETEEFEQLGRALFDAIEPPAVEDAP